MQSGLALALAQNGCTFCLGLGLCPGRNGAQRPCNCVWRAVFRACHAKFRSIVESDRWGGGSSSKRVSHAFFFGGEGSSRRRLKSPNDRIRIREDYVADFCLLARRALRDAGDLAQKIFRFHVLLGAEQPLICRKFGIDQGAFWHELYRVQQRLGRAFAETVPYGLYPIDEYFSGVAWRRTTGGADRGASPLSQSAGVVLQRPGGRPLRAPLVRAAA